MNERDYVLVAPLENLRSDADELVLEKDLSIARLMGVDYRHLSETYSDMPEFDDIAVSSGACTHAIHFRISGERDAVFKDPSLQTVPDDVVSTLRLYKPGRVGIHYVWVRRTDGGPGWLRQPRLRPIYQLPPHYDLFAGEASALVDLYSRVKQHSGDRRYRLALGRFEDTYKELGYEDRLTDSWIALEALFGSRGGAAELSYRLCLRISAVLRPLGSQRVELFHRLRESYGARSRIVHGDLPKGDVQALLQLTEDVARESLRRALEPDWPTEQEMDEIVLGGY